MDTERAIAVLERWIDTADPLRRLFQPAYDSPYRLPYASKDHPQMKSLREWEDQTARIVARVLQMSPPPDLLVTLDHADVQIENGIELCKRSLGVLRTDAETRAILGSVAPTMAADALHSLVWGAASKHWDVGHYSAAVQRAATMLNADVQDRVGRHDVSDAVLMQQTFSTDPPQPERPRLRWPGEDSDLTVKAMRQGILNMSQGVFSAIRNPATHSTEDVARQEALEQLATLSILARWIDRCELVTVEMGEA